MEHVALPPGAASVTRGIKRSLTCPRRNNDVDFKGWVLVTLQIVFFSLKIIFSVSWFSELRWSLLLMFDVLTSRQSQLSESYKVW